METNVQEEIFLVLEELDEEGYDIFGQRSRDIAQKFIDEYEIGNQELLYEITDSIMDWKKNAVDLMLMEHKQENEWQ